MNKWQSMSRKAKVQLILVSGLFLWFWAAQITVWVDGYLYRGQWAIFDSRDYYQVETFPDGVRFEYPKGWGLGIHSKAPPANIGTDRRIDLDAPNFFFWPHTGINVYWQRVDHVWTEEELRNWYTDKVARGVNHQELQEKRTTFQSIMVGQGRYQALLQSYDKITIGLFTIMIQPLERVVLLQVEDEVFAFVLTTPNMKNGAVDAFDRLLNSLEVYR